ncbi:MAG: methyltransferase domain-containing protein [Rhodospirillales bacterium]|jgi:2-polyprenyl-3-methyl-5-hydroxy-6-metoxy-1,4-benzoquinol methylase|nr:methyltransferase domain-containing protein [Rhodospirillales bacterium]
MTENPKDCPYDEAFFNYTMRITMSSARDIVALMRRVLPLESVLDVGCAQGVWLKAWRDSGVMDCDGIDGDHVPRDGMLIDETAFTPADLSQGVSLGRTFDLVQSLEVAEHLPPDAAETFVATLVAHGRLVLFSAAPPGQGGLNHVN